MYIKKNRGAKSFFVQFLRSRQNKANFSKIWEYSGKNITYREIHEMGQL